MPRENRIEATAATLMFGFKDDVVIRIMPTGHGTRIDVRSVSRVGRSDPATNRVHYHRTREIMELGVSARLKASTCCFYFRKQSRIGFSHFFVYTFCII